MTPAQGVDPRAGLPKLRQPWAERRRAAGDKVHRPPQLSVDARSNTVTPGATTLHLCDTISGTSKEGKATVLHVIAMDEFGSAHASVTRRIS